MKTLVVKNDNASQIHNLNLSQDDTTLLPAISGKNIDSQGDNNSSFFLSENDNKAYICILELLSGFPDVSWLVFLVFFQKNYIVILAFFEKIWLKSCLQKNQQFLVFSFLVF